MDRFPPPLHQENYVSPWAKDEMEAEAERVEIMKCKNCGKETDMPFHTCSGAPRREMESEDTKDQECPPLQR